MQYIVSARKYRPSTFDTVVGQKALTATLKHAIASDRLAHAYLFTGSRGVGKTSCARIFAKTINCQHRTADGEACNECPSCLDFNNGTSLNIIELDAASHNGIDDMKALIEQVQMPPTQGRYRVFIIDEVHMLSPAAFNAFLKTLEEPPEHAIFILATTEKHKIIPTILSRCQIYDFNRITIADMVEHLRYVAANEGITADDASLSVIAKKADGAMRDALSIFDQVAAAAMGNITYQSTIANLNILDSSYYRRLVEAMLAGDVPTALLIYRDIRDKGFDSQFFVNGLAQYLRDLMVARQPQTLALLDASDDERAEYAALAQRCAPQFLYRAMDLCNDADLNYRLAANKQFLVELTLIKQCQLLSPSPNGDGEGLKEITVQPAPQLASEPKAPYPQATPAAATQPAPAQPTPAQPTPVQPTVVSGSAADTPRPATPRITAPQAPRMAGRTMSIRKAAPQAQPGAPAAAPAATNSQPYTHEALVEQWQAYAAAHPTERILVNTMAAATPQLIDGDKYRVSVDDQIQVDELVEAKPEILKHLRHALGNDNIDLDIQISASTEGNHVTWTQREVLQHFAEQQPALARLIQDFGFTLA